MNEEVKNMLLQQMNIMQEACAEGGDLEGIAHVSAVMLNYAVMLCDEDEDDWEDDPE